MHYHPMRYEHNNCISMPYGGVLALFSIFGDFLELNMIFGDFLQVI